MNIKPILVLLILSFIFTQNIKGNTSCDDPKIDAQITLLTKIIIKRVLNPKTDYQFILEDGGQVHQNMRNLVLNLEECYYQSTAFKELVMTYYLEMHYCEEKLGGWNYMIGGDEEHNKIAIDKFGQIMFTSLLKIIDSEHGEFFTSDVLVEFLKTKPNYPIKNDSLKRLVRVIQTME